jgi:hypothetical protein
MPETIITDDQPIVTEVVETGSSWLIETIKMMIPATQIPVDLRKTTKMINPEKGIPFTSKDKAVIGVSKDRIITWGQVNFETSDSEKFGLLADEVGMKASELAASIVMTWFKDHRTEINEIVTVKMKKEVTAADVEKKLKALQVQLDKMNELKKTMGL